MKVKPPPSFISVVFSIFVPPPAVRFIFGLLRGILFSSAFCLQSSALADSTFTAANCFLCFPSPSLSLSPDLSWFPINRQIVRRRSGPHLPPSLLHSRPSLTQLPDLFLPPRRHSRPPPSPFSPSRSQSSAIPHANHHPLFLSVTVAPPLPITRPPSAIRLLISSVEIHSFSTFHCSRLVHRCLVQKSFLSLDPLTISSLPHLLRPVGAAALLPQSPTSRYRPPVPDRLSFSVKHHPRPLGPNRQAQLQQPNSKTWPNLLLNSPPTQLPPQKLTSSKEN